MTDIDAAQVGFYGASEAGWVVPLANARLHQPVAFTALVNAPLAGPTNRFRPIAPWSSSSG